MRAAFVEKADAAVMGAESDEILAQDADTLGIAARLQPCRRHHRHPELAHEIAHRRARPDAAQKFVLFLQHGSLPVALSRPTAYDKPMIG